MLIYLFSKIMSMEKMMSSIAKRLAKELLIQFNYIWVLMRHTNLFAVIFSIYSFHTRFYDARLSMLERLTGTTDTTSRTCHNLNGMEIIHTCPYTIEKFSGITECMRHTDMKLQAV